MRFVLSVLALVICKGALAQSLLPLSSVVERSSVLDLSAPDLVYTVNVTDSRFGAKCDGTTDDTTAINKAIDVVNAMGGGTVLIPAAKCLMKGAMIIPYTGTTKPVQNPITVAGIGGSPDSYLGSDGTVQPIGGSILDMRYAGGDGTHVAKIDTRGGGRLTIRDLKIIDGGTDNYLFIQTTNTTLNIHDVAFLGNASCSLRTCAQNVIQLGGDTSASSTLGTNAATAGFQGYGTYIRDNHFSHIQIAVAFGGSANAVLLDNNTIDHTCGSSDAQGAPYVFQGVGLGAQGNIISNGIVEIAGYPYAAALIGTGSNSYNNFISMGVYDEVMGNPTVGAYYFAATSPYNTSIAGNADGSIAANMLNGPGAASQTSIVGVNSSNQVSQLVSGLNVGGNVKIGTDTAGSKLALHGNNSGTNGGTALFFYDGGTLHGGVGSYSSVLGGGYNPQTLLYGYLGLRFNTLQTDAGNVDIYQHWLFGNSDAPTIASGTCGAGSNGTLATNANDMSGLINIGPAATTLCTFTAAHAWLNSARACIISPANAAAASSTAYVPPPTTAGFVIRGSTLASTSWNYHCY